MAYNTQEERLIVKGSERITRDLQVNHNIYVNQDINAKDVYVQNNLSVNTGNIENISTNNLNVANAVINSFNANTSTIENLNANNFSVTNLIVNNTTGNDGEVLGKVNGNLGWLNTTPVIVMEENDYNNLNVIPSNLFYLTMPNGNLYVNHYGYAPSILPPPPYYWAFMELHNIGLNEAILDFTKDVAITNALLGDSTIINTEKCTGKYLIEPTNIINVSMTSPNMIQTNADYIYFTNISYAFANCNLYNNERNVFLFDSSAIINKTENYNPWDYVQDASYAFYNCKVNALVAKVGNNVINASHMYDNMYFYNSSEGSGKSHGLTGVVCPDSVIDASYMYYSALDTSVWRHNLYVGNNVINASHMFAHAQAYYNVYSLHWDINNSVVSDASYMFVNANTYILPELPVTLTNASGMYEHTYVATHTYKTPVCPDTIINAHAMYSQCRGIQGNPVVGNNVIDASEMYLWYEYPAQPVCSGSVINASMMYSGSINIIGSPVCPNSVVDAGYMYSACSNLTGRAIIGRNVEYARSIYDGCVNLSGDAYVYSTKLNFNSPRGFNNAFLGCTNLVRVHINHLIKLGNTGNNIYNALINNMTGINWTGKIVNDL